MYFVLCTEYFILNLKTQDLGLKTHKMVSKGFGGKLRVRVSGLLVQEGRLLLLLHEGIGSTGRLWLPPGGGMEYGSSMTDNVIREVAEETGLQVLPQQLVDVHEHLQPPLHAVELFFACEITGGECKLGTDPELAADQQMITALRWMSPEELSALPRAEKHPLLNKSGLFEVILQGQSFL